MGKLLFAHITPEVKEQIARLRDTDHAESAPARPGLLVCGIEATGVTGAAFAHGGVA